MPLLTTIPSIILSLPSAYGATLTYKTVTRLQTYESQSEKAAEWSTTAADRLHKTRTTQTGAAISLALSLLSTILTLTLPTFHPVLIAVINATALSLSREHMQNFWNQRNQAKIPFVEKFNRAVEGSQELVTLQQLLALGWAMAGGVWWWVGV